MCVVNSKLKASLTNRTVSLSFLFLLLISMSESAQSVITTYTDEATYLADLSSYVQISESFEDNDWNLVRSAVLNTQALPSITNLGLTWEHRFTPNGNVTTGDAGGDVHNGNWLFYATPHHGYGVPGLDCTLPGECSDGFTVTSGSAGPLYGIGGWFIGAGGAEFKVLLDDVEVPGAGGSANNTWQFYGVIDTDGFSKVDIMEISGTLGDYNFIWADDFTFGATTLPPSPGGVEFSAFDYSVSEGVATVEITVERTNGFTGEVTVDYSTSDDTATAGEDYTATSGTLTFADGDATAQTFSIPIINNPGFEDPETLFLDLSNATNGAVLGALSSAVLTITDADPGTLQFSMSNYSVYEDAVIPTKITVERVNGFTGDVSVDYTTINGTATAGEDYTTTSGTFYFADGGVTTQTFGIPIINNPGFEGDETVTLSLSNATGGAVLGTDAALTIIDFDVAPNPGTLQFSAPTYTVAENGLTASITVTRVGGSLGEASVDYVITDGSANSGSDYTAVNGTVTFAAGDAATKSFSINIVNSAGTYEGNETVNLSLSNATGAVLGGRPVPC